MSRPSEQDLIFIPPVDADGNVIQTDEESGPWQGAATEAYAAKTGVVSDVRFKDLNEDNRNVLEDPLSSVNEFIYSTVGAFNLMDTDKSGTVSYAEVQAAQTAKWLKGQDSLVIAGLLERNAFDRIATFTNDQRGKETELSRSDVWEMAEKANDSAYANSTIRARKNVDAIVAAYNAAMIKQARDNASAGM